MKVAALALISGIVLLATTSSTLAPIAGTFPGLDDLISDADVIAVVTISGGRPKSVVGYNDYTVEVRKELKGKLPKRSIKLSLRALDVSTEAERESRMGFSDTQYARHSNHIVFLEENKNWAGRASYHSLNRVGGTMPVSPYWEAYPSLRITTNKAPRVAIEDLLQDYVAYKQAELRHIEERSRRIISGLREGPNKTRNQTPDFVGSRLE